MADREGENQGLFEAHTPPENSGVAADPERAAKVGSTRATVEASMTDLAQQLAVPTAEPEQQSLLLDEADELCLFKGPVRHVAETLATAKRGRGRPPGSQNKASRDFADTLMRMGFRHPGINLAHMANADPYALAIELSGIDPGRYPEWASLEPLPWLDRMVRLAVLTHAEVVSLIAKAHDLIGKANAELLPYFQSKAAQKIEVDKNMRGVMVIGDMRTEQAASGGFMSLTRVDEAE